MSPSVVCILTWLRRVCFSTIEDSKLFQTYSYKLICIETKTYETKNPNPKQKHRNIL